MQLVREDLARQAIVALRNTSEWPFNAIFLFVRSYTVFAIASGKVTHGDLFLILKDAADQLNPGDLPLQRVGDIYDGHLEWESDGTYFARTHAGQRLPVDLELALYAEIDRLMKEMS